MTEDEQEARAIKWAGPRTVLIARLSSGQFAMYGIGGIGSPFWVGPADQLLAAYEARPPYAYSPPAPRPVKVGGIDVASLDFNL